MGVRNGRLAELARVALAVLLSALWDAPAWAQPPGTRVEEIEQARREKEARLWPERESPMVGEVNRQIERGLGTGVKTGKGVSGLYAVLGGMRSGQGMSFGLGYGRTDIWHERLDVRTTARMTPQLAYLLDAKVDLNSLRSARSFGEFYVKFEHSPKMDYYGQGPNSAEGNRSSFLLDDLAGDVNVGFTIFRGLRLGLTGGGVSVHTSGGKRAGVPASQDLFPVEELPGLEADADFARWGGFVAVDRRDDRYGPRAGFIAAVRLRKYTDLTRHKYSFRQADFEYQQYIPYFNKARVIALRLASALTYSYSEDAIPIYFQPTLGGNDNLRAYARYRFYDNHMIFASAEHRWYVSAGLDMAVFAETGKVAASREDLGLSDLRYGGGIGFRFKFKNATFMRIDFATGREGFRAMWTFSDAFKVPY